MDSLVRQAFENDRRRTERRLIRAIADVREQLLRIEDTVSAGAPLAGSRACQLVQLAGETAIAAGTLDTLVEWGNVFDAQSNDGRRRHGGA
jgi:hypothetical protein